MCSKILQMDEGTIFIYTKFFFIKAVKIRIIILFIKFKYIIRLLSGNIYFLRHRLISKYKETSYRLCFIIFQGQYFMNGHTCIKTPIPRYVALKTKTKFLQNFQIINSSVMHTSTIIKMEINI